MINKILKQSNKNIIEDINQIILKIEDQSHL